VLGAHVNAPDRTASGHGPRYRSTRDGGGVRRHGRGARSEERKQIVQRRLRDSMCREMLTVVVAGLDLQYVMGLTQDTFIAYVDRHP
jgi:hypothetical protein